MRFFAVMNDIELINKWKETILANPIEHGVKEVELKAKIKRIKFDILEKDLREDFIKGFGPGG